MTRQCLHILRGACCSEGECTHPDEQCNEGTASCQICGGALDFCEEHFADAERSEEPHECPMRKGLGSKSDPEGGRGER
jgi:hypothetical protein